MTTLIELQIQQRTLLDDLEELETAVSLLVEKSSNNFEMDEDETADHQQQMAWLQRQRAGLLVVLSETERGLMAFDGDPVGD
ncbi:MAG: hypothetical protein HC889_12440 [Synechococcaceae cyanobacterium SM1_2_3]|nr:hypothetical protein [Synechococcaceae cyanobacterium SM1_2_3]